jgi:RimJ/RimL family protein N-acetyltransferase
VNAGALPAPALGDGTVLVRALGADDAPAVAAAVPPGVDGVWDATPGPYPLEVATGLIAAWEADRRVGERLALGVFAAAGAVPDGPGAHELLGGVVLQRGAPGAPQDPRAGDQLEAAYWIRPEWRGRGYAGRALLLTTAWALSLPALRRLWLEVAREHGASRRVAARAAFALVGLRRRELTSGSGVGDVLIYERRS